MRYLSFVVLSVFLVVGHFQSNLFSQDKTAEKPKLNESNSNSSNPKRKKTESTKATKKTETEIVAGKSLSLTYEFSEDVKEMPYQLYLPKNYFDETKKDPKKRYPLIVALHGYGSNPKQLLGYPGFIRHAEKRGYILIAPMGYNKRGWYGSRGQTSRFGSPRNLGELSEKDVMNVLNIAKSKFKIDDDRIYLYGHSMGGGGAIYLAMKYPKVWAAIAPMAPAVPRGLDNLKNAKQIPAIIVHGDNDRTLNVKGTRRLIEKMKELGFNHKYIEVEKGDHVTVAFRYWDEVFGMFDKHSRKKASKKTEANSKTESKK